MRIAHYRNILVALLTLVFIGQTVAATTMSCLQQTSQTGGQAHVMGAAVMGSTVMELPAINSAADHAAMDHSRHMNITSADTMSSAEHCSNCDCDVGGCSVTVVPSTEQNLLPVLSTPVKGHLNLAVKQLASSPYHPPE